MKRRVPKIKLKDIPTVATVNALRERMLLAMARPANRPHLGGFARCVRMMNECLKKLGVGA